MPAKTKEGEDAVADIPEPIDPGSTGTQIIGTTDIVVIRQESPLHGLPITDAVAGLTASMSNRMGGVAAGLLTGSFAQLSLDLQEKKQELRSTSQKLEHTRDELNNYKTKTAVLEERVNANSRNKHLRNLSIFVGTLLITFGFELYRNNIERAPYIVGGLGFILLLFGWLSNGRRAEK